MSAPPPKVDPPTQASRVKPTLYAVVGLLAVSAVLIYRQHVEIKALQAQLIILSTICPSDVFPRDVDHCGSDGTPACGVAAWFGSSTNGKCRVTELKTGTGCGVCYAGQVSPCLISDYRKGCDGQASTCGVRYCLQTTTGSYDYEDLCRPIGPPPP